MKLKPALLTYHVPRGFASRAALADQMNEAARRLYELRQRGRTPHAAWRDAPGSGDHAQPPPGQPRALPAAPADTVLVPDRVSAWSPLAEAPFGHERFWTTWVVDRRLGCAGLRLHRDGSGTSILAEVMFWDACGYFTVRTAGAGVPVEVLDALITEARVRVPIL